MPDQENLHQIVDAKVNSTKDQMLDFAINVLGIDATNPSFGGPGELARAEYLTKFLKAERFEVQRLDVRDKEHGTRPNVLTKIKGKDQSRTLWFVTHLDTVPSGPRELWKTDPFLPVIKDGKIFARGSMDNGQALISSFFALKVIRDMGLEPPLNVGLICLCDEEAGDRYGAKYLLTKQILKPDDLIFVSDGGSPNGDEIEIAEKGAIWSKFTVFGKQVHASRPSSGNNAHRIGMDFSLRVDEELHRKFNKHNKLFHDEPRSTFEPTKIERNVENINTIPGLDTFYFDSRVLPDYNLDLIIKKIGQVIESYENRYHVKITHNLVERSDAGPITDPKSPVVQSVLRAVKLWKKNRPIRLIGTGGQSVGNHFRKAGLQVALWGTVDHVAHEANEYCRVNNLLSDTKVFVSTPFINGYS